MFVATLLMLSGLPRFLQHRDPPDTTRHGLVAEIELVSAAQSALDAYRRRITAAIDGLGDRGLDAAGVLRTVGRMSSRAAGPVAKTAAPMTKLPGAVEALAAAAITAEHADVLADATGSVDAQLVDTDLVKIACASPADLFARRAREWVSRRQHHGDTNQRQVRQHHDRAVTSWADPDGMKVWLAKLDPVTAASVTSSLEAEYDRLWRLDGGRDATKAQACTRTSKQRMADAFVSLITGPGAGSLTGRTHVRQHMLSIVDLPRDHGCIGCGADPNRCEAHHIRAWNRGGPTDITNLVLVCSRCHHDIHDRDMTLARSPGGWTITTRAGPNRDTVAA